MRLHDAETHAQALLHKDKVEEKLPGRSPSAATHAQEAMNAHRGRRRRGTTYRAEDKRRSSKRSSQDSYDTLKEPTSASRASSRDTTTPTQEARKGRTRASVAC